MNTYSLGVSKEGVLRGMRGGLSGTCIMYNSLSRLFCSARTRFEAPQSQRFLCVSVFGSVRRVVSRRRIPFFRRISLQTLDYTYFEVSSKGEVSINYLLVMR